MITLSNGYIRLYRKLLDNPIMYKPELLQLFIYCLLKANHKPERMIFNGAEIIIESGQFVTGREVLADALNQNGRTLYDRLKVLEKLKVISLLSNNRFTLVTVLNYGVYQRNKNEIQQQSNNKPTSDQQQANTNKNDKNDKNDKKKYSEHVFLSLSEYQKLVDLYGEFSTKAKIEELNLWKGSKGITDKKGNDFYTIQKFDNYQKEAAKRQLKEGFNEKKVPNKGNFKQRQYSDEYLESLYSV